MHSTSSGRYTGLIAVSLGLMLAAAAAPFAHAEEKLVAPVFPGAARLSGTKLGVDEGVTFFVKESHEKVQAF